MVPTIRSSLPPDAATDAEPIVREALEAAERTLPLDEDVVVELDWTDADHVVSRMDGVAGYPEYPNRLLLEVNTEPSDWRPALRSLTAHEYAHLWDRSRRGGPYERRWEYVLGEALTQHFAARQVPEYTAPWRVAHDGEDLAAWWPRIRDDALDADLDAVEVDGRDPMFVDLGDGDYPNWLGYSLAYRIGERLLERHDLTEFPALTRADVLAAGDHLFS